MASESEKKKLRPRIVVVGSSNTDLVVLVERLPNPGETLLGGGFKQYAGGKGANQAVAAARAGARVAFVGRCGADDLGAKTCMGLHREGINLSYFVEDESRSSGVALIMIGGRESENLIVVAQSANDGVGRSDVMAASDTIRLAGAVVAQLEVPLEAVETAAELARETGIPFILNPAPARELPAGLLNKVDVLVPNRHEVSLLAGKDDVDEAAEELLKRGCREVVVTLGGQGVQIYNSGGRVDVPAVKVDAVDTVGAGDCFTGWLAVGIAEGLSMEASVRQAVKAAAISVTREGAQPSMPKRDEV
ncbi:MAG: ribokinase [Verrucomicrobia bacterium]|nr:MAG: ribokinase [Verrucomicrobiota bacterium]